MADLRPLLSATFGLTREEKILLASVLGLALLGLTARYLYLRQQKPETYVPAALPTTAPLTPAIRTGGVED